MSEEYVDIRFKVSHQRKYGVLTLECPDDLNIEMSVSKNKSFSKTDTTRFCFDIFKQSKAVVNNQKIHSLHKECIHDTVKAGQIWRNSVGKKCIILEVYDCSAKFYHCDSKQTYKADKYKFYNDYWSRA